MGAGEAAAHVAMIMLNFTDDVDVLLRGDEPEWSDETDEQLRAHPIDIVEADIDGMNKSDNGWLESFEFEDGSVRQYRGGFAMYGSNYNTALFETLGCELSDDGTVIVDESMETTVEGVYAVGDITDGHNQIPVAMGKGAQAGIDIHYQLREFPRDLETIRTEGAVADTDVPAVSNRLREAAASFEEAQAPPIDTPSPTTDAEAEAIEPTSDD
jgi:thioredoxin reductase (NADPH)